MTFLFKLAEARRLFMVIAFQLCFRMCYQERLRKSGKTGSEGNTRALGLYWRC